jgi:hypothetical protein
MEQLESKKIEKTSLFENSLFVFFLFSVGLADLIRRAISHEYNILNILFTIFSLILFIKTLKTKKSKT